MSEHGRGEQYELAIRRLQEHLIKAEDGTFHLDAKVSAKTLDIDPVLFADLKRSLAHTNKLIKRRQIEPSEVEFI